LKIGISESSIGSKVSFGSVDYSQKPSASPVGSEFLKINLSHQLFSVKNSDEIVYFQIQGVRGQSGFFNWALRERNIQLRLHFKIVLKSWDVDILIIRTNFYKSNIGWPQQPPAEKVQKLKNDISWFHQK
jgi:hypothetical protein